MDRNFEQILAHITLEHYRRLSRVIKEDWQFRYDTKLESTTVASMADALEHSGTSMADALEPSGTSRNMGRSQTQPAWTSSESLNFQPVDSINSCVDELSKKESVKMKSSNLAVSAGVEERGHEADLFPLLPQAVEPSTATSSPNVKPPEAAFPNGEELPLPNAPCEELPEIEKIKTSPGQVLSHQKSTLSRRGTGTISLPGLAESAGPVRNAMSDAGFPSPAVVSPRNVMSDSAFSIALKLKAKGRSHKRSATNCNKELLRPYSVWAEALPTEDHITSLFQSSKTVNTLAFSHFKERKSGTNLFDLMEKGGFGLHARLKLALSPKSWVCDPSSKHKLVWDFLGMFLLAYDIVFIPLQIFELPVNQFTMTMQWLTLAYWLMDVPMSFLVGFHRGGMIEMRVREIAKRYLRTWFCMDVLLLIIDAVLLAEQYDEKGVSENPAGFARVGKTFRVMRVLRAVRLLRLFKLPATWSYLQESIQSETTFLIMGVIKMAISILVINHFVACMWYGLSGLHDGGSNWRVHPHSDLLDGSASIPYLYTTSLHWSLTQFTPASMEVHPRNVAERIFAVVVIVFAMIVFSSFVSSITNAMNTLKNMSSEHQKNFMVLQRYFRNHQISLKLCVRVRRHLDVVLQKGKQNIQEEDVKLLPMLSENLRVELHHEIFGPALSVHKFFARFEAEHPRTLYKICHKAVSTLVFLKGDVLFSLGEKASNMYFVRNGRVRYTMKDDFMSNSEGPRPSMSQNWTQLHEGDWLSEATLWTPWVHQGHALAYDEETLVAIEPTRFHDVVRLHGSALDGAAKYGVIFVKHMQRPDVLWSDLIDVGFDIDRAVDVAFYDTNDSDDEDAWHSEDQAQPVRRVSLQGSHQGHPSASCSERQQ